jgi:dTDP-4-amino-4,6-dideoxygalactose transaminase
MLSHMRGHVGDLDALMALCDRYGVTVIEDCAHTLGARWNGRPVGTFGRIACFSAQTFKHINGGEGGILATDDPEIAARATIFSGSYMMYEQNSARPPLSAFETIRDETPNFSMRMTDLTAALLRPQLAMLDGWVKAWNAAHDHVQSGLTDIPHLAPIVRDSREAYVGSSIQFRADGLPPDGIERFVAEAGDHGVYLKWFGAPRTVGFTSRYDQWDYAPSKDALAGADRILSTLLDMRLPVTLDADDCDTILAVLAESMAAVAP